MMSLKLLLELLLLLNMLFMRPPLTKMLLFVTSSPGDLHGDFWSRLRVGEELGLEVAEEVCWGGVGRVGDGSSIVPSGSAIEEAVDFLPVKQTEERKLQDLLYKYFSCYFLLRINIYN